MLIFPDLKKNSNITARKLNNGYSVDSNPSADCLKSPVQRFNLFPSMISMRKNFVVPLIKKTVISPAPDSSSIILVSHKLKLSSRSIGTIRKTKLNFNKTFKYKIKQS